MSLIMVVCDRGLPTYSCFCLPPSATWTLHAATIEMPSQCMQAWLPLQLFAGKPYSICLLSRTTTHVVMF